MHDIPDTCINCGDETAHGYIYGHQQTDHVPHKGGEGQHSITPPPPPPLSLSLSLNTYDYDDR